MPVIRISLYIKETKKLQDLFFSLIIFKTSQTPDLIGYWNFHIIFHKEPIF